MLGAFFMATDYVTSPVTPWGRVLFAFGAGIIVLLSGILDLILKVYVFQY